MGWRYDIGPSPWDRTQIAFVNFVYQVPFLKNSDNHFLKTTIGGWELSGIITMDSGQPINIGINGQNVAALRPAAIPFLRRNLGLVFQDQKLLYDRSVHENLMLPLSFSSLAQREAARRARAALDKVGLLGREKASPV